MKSKRLIDPCPDLLNRSEYDIDLFARKDVTLNSPIAPIPILFSHSHHQFLDLAIGARTSGCALGGAIVFLGDEFSMPGQQGLGRNDAGHFCQPFASHAFAFGGQATPLVIIQSQAPIAKLLAEYAVFLAQIFDHLLLGLIHPSGHRDEQEAEGIENFFHPLFIIVEQGMLVG